MELKGCGCLLVAVALVGALGALVIGGTLLTLSRTSGGGASVEYRPGAIGSPADGLTAEAFARSALITTADLPNGWEVVPAAGTGDGTSAADACRPLHSSDGVIASTRLEPKDESNRGFTQVVVVYRSVEASAQAAETVTASLSCVARLMRQGALDTADVTHHDAAVSIEPITGRGDAAAEVTLEYQVSPRGTGPVEDIRITKELWVRTGRCLSVIETQERFVPFISVGLQDAELDALLHMAADRLDRCPD